MSLENWIITILSFIVGFQLGRSLRVVELKEKVEQAKEIVVDNLSTDDLPVGIIKRPDAKQWHKTHQDPTKQAADDAMRESLKDIPELNERR